MVRVVKCTLIAASFVSLVGYVVIPCKSSGKINSSKEFRMLTEIKNIKCYPATNDSETYIDTPATSAEGDWAH